MLDTGATILGAIFIPLFIWLLYWYYKWSYFETYLKNIPGPRPWPIFGNALEFRLPTAILPQLQKYHNTYKKLFKIYIKEEPYLITCDLDSLELVFNSPKAITKAKAYNFFHNWLGTGLLTSTGEKWRKHRKIITPSFHFQILSEFIDVFNSNSDILISKLMANSDKGSFDIYPYINRCSLDIICEAVMGTSVNAQNDAESEYVKCVETLLSIIVERNLSPITSNDFLYRFSEVYRREKEALKVVHDYSKSVIEKRKGEFLTSLNETEKDVDSLGRKKRRAFLDSLLEYSLKDSTLTDKHIQEEVDTFMFEGHDTTGSAIAFALHSLANNADVQKKAYNELQQVFADDSKRNVTHNDLNNMKYLEMVIKESLRVYPSVPYYARTLEENVEYNGMKIPKGVTLFIPAHTLQNSDLIYENPEKFDPERFNSENSKGRHPFVYIPFSAGPRNCIGQKFAILEMKSMISSILQHFELLPVQGEEEIVLRGELILRAENGVMVQLKNRN